MKPRTVVFAAVCALFPTVSYSGSQSGEASAPPEQRAAKTALAPAAATIKARLSDAAAVKPVEDEFGAPIGAFADRVYAANGYAPIWTKAGAQSLLDATRRLFDYGIVVDDESLAFIESLAARLDKRETDEARAAADLELSLVFLRVADAITGGLSKQRKIALAAPMPGQTDLGETLRRSAAGEALAAIGALAPDHPQYRGAVAALARYRAMEVAGGWYAIAAGPPLKPGGEDARLPALRARLAAEGFVAADAAPGAAGSLLYDPATLAAVVAFQDRHGLEPDGVVGPGTLDAMNESAASKIDRIAATLQHMRGLGEIGDRYIWANIPSYLAEGWSGGARQIRMRTVVGKKGHETPEFSDEVEYVVANPKWYMPISIQKSSAVPHMRNDPGYAAKHHFRIYEAKSGAEVDPASVDWSAPGAATRYRFVQSPGPDNSLGDLKIIFPNQYSIYLHGTPAKSLFARAERAFSHGCIRLEDPVAMAEWIAAGEAKLTPGDVETSVSSGENKRITLETRVPVHITYYTVTINDDGSANFWRDVYGREKGAAYAKAYAHGETPPPIRE